MNLFTDLHTHIDMNIQSLSIGVCEFSGLGREALVIFLEQFRDLRLQWVVCVRVLQQGHQGLNDELGIQGGHPRVLNGLSADLTGVLLDVGVEDLGLEEDLGSLEGIVVAEVDVHDELPTLVGGVRGPDNSRVPLGKSVTDEGDGDTLDGLVHVQVCQFLWGRSLVK